MGFAYLNKWMFLIMEGIALKLSTNIHISLNSPCLQCMENVFIVVFYLIYNTFSGIKYGVVCVNLPSCKALPLINRFFNFVKKFSKVCTWLCYQDLLIAFKTRN